MGKGQGLARGGAGGVMAAAGGLGAGGIPGTGLGACCNACNSENKDTLKSYIAFWVPFVLRNFSFSSCLLGAKPPFPVCFGNTRGSWQDFCPVPVQQAVEVRRRCCVPLRARPWAQRGPRPLVKGLWRPRGPGQGLQHPLVLTHSISYVFSLHSYTQMLVLKTICVTPALPQIRCMWNPAAAASRLISTWGDKGSLCLNYIKIGGVGCHHCDHCATRKRNERLRGERHPSFQSPWRREKVLENPVTIEGTLVLALRQILCLQCHFDLENKKEEKAMCTAARPVSSRLIGSSGVEESDAWTASRCARQITHARRRRGVMTPWLLEGAVCTTQTSAEDTLLYESLL